MNRWSTLGVAAVLVAGSASAGVIDPALQQILVQADPNKTFSVLAYLNEQVDTAEITRQMDVGRATLRTRHETVVSALRERAGATQPGTIAHLDALKAQGRISAFKPFWIANIIKVDASPAEIVALAARPEVDRVYLDFPIETIAPVPPAPGGGVPPGGQPEPGVAAIGAPEVWDMGIDGTGVVVATLDTGVDGSHPALLSRWRGLDPAYAGHPEWAFYDPVTNWTFPQDSGSHGTHTMGTVCGGAPGDQVGVAPGAQWIHAAVIDRVSIAQTVSDAIAAFQWLIDPDGNAGTSFDVPTSCSNSWGVTTSHGYAPCDATFWSFIDACEAAGIVMIFAAGNEGPSPQTVRRPADRATDGYRNLAVAAVDANSGSFPIAGFSSRGPSFCGPEGQQAIKPDIAAPGVSVRSSVPGGSYAPSNGTSMSTPHVNGVVALMRQANPDLSVDQVKQIIYDTATDLGSVAEDNDYGWGMINAFEAVQQALGTASLTFSFPDGRPEFIEPSGGTTIRVLVTGTATSPVAGTGALHYSTGGPFAQIPMTDVAPGEFDAVFPALGCGDAVTYYFSVEADSGDTIVNPFNAPANHYSGDAYTGVSYAFLDNFETNLGWTTSNSGGLTTGAWQRGVPLGGGDRGDPATDADDSGSCYVTGIADGDNDIDGGTTTLSTPNLDATDPGARLIYWRWYNNTAGADPGNDLFIVEVSDNGGSSWVNLETVGPSGPEVSGGWFLREFPIAGMSGVTGSTQFRVRFHASDLNAGSVVEAGVDGVEISSLYCDEATCADLDSDGEVGILDLLDMLGAWGQVGHPADLLPPPGVGVEDILLLLAGWGPCPG